MSHEASIQEIKDDIYKKIIIDKNGCWLWQKRINKSGYGITSRVYKGKIESQPHRLSYKVHIGDIKPRLMLDHLCRVRNCVNPYHLEPVTHRENQLRGIGFVFQNFNKDICINGHAFNSKNTIYSKSKDGYDHRECRKCRREIYKRWANKLAIKWNTSQHKARILEQKERNSL